MPPTRSSRTVLVAGGAGSTSSHDRRPSSIPKQPTVARASRVLRERPAHGRPARRSSRRPAVGYLRGGELYDPLINGKTIGNIVGPVTFIPGVGVRLETFDSRIVYEMPRAGGGW